MSDMFHACSVARSRKQRRCDWCDELIRIGEPYKAYSWRDGGDLGRTTVHPECRAASHDFVASGGDEWLIGVFTRGCCCERGDCRCNKAVEG